MVDIIEYLNSIKLIIITTLIIISYLIYRFIRKSKISKSKETILIIGPNDTGKTVFYYYLLMGKKVGTVTSMEINSVYNYKSDILKNDKTINLIDIPGNAFFKEKIFENLKDTKILLFFIDSCNKNSINQSAEILYDILNYNDYTNDIIIVCNKQDNEFPKTKKMIENDLSKEIDNLIKIKQKNNLEMDNQQNFGYLFTLKSKFNFQLFKNISFIETDVTSGYKNLLFETKKILNIDEIIQ